MAALFFDLDGTLAEPLKPISFGVSTWLAEQRDRGHRLFLVAGSDSKKVMNQIEKQKHLFDFIFTDSGNTCIQRNNILWQNQHTFSLGDQIIILGYAEAMRSNLLTKFKLGDHILEKRVASLNVALVGRDCSEDTRKAFYYYDKQHKLRERFAAIIEHSLPNIQVLIGGQISIDILPIGKGKEQITKNVEILPSEEVYFFSDMIHLHRGNDLLLSLELYYLYRERYHAMHVLDPENIKNITIKECQLGET